MVSHDRICTHLIVFEGDSVAKMYIGNWSDYETMMQEKVWERPGFEFDPVYRIIS